MKKYNVEDVENNIDIIWHDPDGAGSLFFIRDTFTDVQLAEVYGHPSSAGILIGDYEDVEHEEYSDINVFETIDIIFSHIVLGFSELTSAERRKVRMNFQTYIANWMEDEDGNIRFEESCV